MVGTPCWAASTTARPQPSLRDGSTCTQELCSTWCLVTSSTWPWKVTASEMPSRCDVVDEPLSPPAAADDVEVQARYPGPQLARPPPAHPRSACAAPAATAPPLAVAAARGPDNDLRRRLVETVAHHRDPLVVHAERDQIAGRRQRHRQVLIAPVHPRRQRRLDKPAEPAEHRPGHRPLLAMAVVHQHHHPPAVHQPGQERQAVLGVDDHVGPHSPQRPEPDPRQRPSPATPRRRRSSARRRG